MYIRRKVFSILQDEMGEERYFSTTDFELEDSFDERFYSEDDTVKKNIFKRGGEWVKNTWNAGGAKQQGRIAKRVEKKLGKMTEEQLAKAGGKQGVAEKLMKRAKIGNRAAMIATPLVAAGTIYGVSKHRKISNLKKK